MGPTCRRVRMELPEGRHGPGWGAPEVQELNDHVHACVACADWISRTERRHAMLHSMPRLVAPRILEARVEQALGADGRSERIEHALRSLGRQRSPAELESAVEAVAAPELAGPRAPAVLERLVGEELADLPKARARRFLGSLDRLPAPRRLAHMVALETARPAGARVRSVPAWIAGSLVLASVLVATLALPLARRERASTRSLAALEPLTSSAQLDPFARGLLDALSGGIASVEAP